MFGSLGDLLSQVGAGLVMIASFRLKNWRKGSSPKITDRKPVPISKSIDDWKLEPVTVTDQPPYQLPEAASSRPSAAEATVKSLTDTDQRQLSRIGDYVKKSCEGSTTSDLCIEAELGICPAKEYDTDTLVKDVRCLKGGDWEIVYHLQP